MAAEVPQPSFIAGLTLPTHKEDAAKLLELARADGYDFVTTSLPPAPSKPNGGAGAAASLQPPRTDVTALESKWWSTSIVGAVVDPLGFQSSGGAVAAASGDGDSSMHDGTSCTNERTIHSGGGLISALGSTDSKQAVEATRHLKFMLDWAGHMSIPAAILPSVPVDDPNGATQYARLLTTLALECSVSNVQLWVRVAANPEALVAYELLHKRCDHPANLGCILCFDDDTSYSSITSENVGQYLVLVHKLVGCNLRAVSFSTGVYLTNKRGYPTLPKSHQMLFTELLRRLGRTLRVLVEGMPQPQQRGAVAGPTKEAAGYTGCLPHLQYLRHIRTRSEITSVLDTEEARMETSYLDHLQSPLQPLGDNLEFQTYETFEKDPVKYARYEDAVYLAIKDGMRQDLYPHSKQGGADFCTVNIMVVGAGRGPLVRASLDAIDRINGSRTVGASESVVKARIIAMEKNSSAVIYLRSLQSTDVRWREAVTVVECDMRYANKHPVLKDIITFERMKADVVVSELLGSFGDNELSPECLDGVERCGLMKATCVSIPQEYTAYIAPVSSMRLYSEAHAQAYIPCNPSDGPMGRPSGTLQAIETPYVVRTHAASQTHFEQRCWDFSHPHKANGRSVEKVDNDRSISLVFGPDGTHGSGHGPGYGAFDVAAAEISASGDGGDASGGITIHGFLGTFHSTLYQSIGDKKESSVISVAPSTFSVGMFSWFPLFFPLREPLQVPSGASIGLNMWRRGNNDKVWYEWSAEVFMAGAGTNKSGAIVHASPVHNPNGRSYFVRL